MTQLPWLELLAVVLGWAMIAAVAGAVILAIYWPVRHTEPIWPPQRLRRIRWTVVEFIIIFIAAIQVPQHLLVTFLSQDQSLMFRLGGQMLADTTAALNHGGVPGVTLMTGVLAGHQIEHVAKASFTRLRWSIWLMLGINAFLILVMLFQRAQVKASGYPPWTAFGRPRAAMMMGYLGWLVVTLPVFAIFILVQMPWFTDVLGPSRTHPVADLLRLATRWDLVATSLLVLINAPIFEELLLRGVLQPLMVRRPLVADTLMLLAIGVAVVNSVGPESGPRTFSWGALLFVVTAGPGYLLFESLTDRWFHHAGAARAVYASSILFAAMHAAVWPSPIPLFFLSLALGFVAYRTQSLVAPMTLHALFNGVTLAAQGVEPWLRQALAG
jgi:membrane protease YdiL (CAAX protease family)